MIKERSISHNLVDSWTDRMRSMPYSCPGLTSSSWSKTQPEEAVWRQIGQASRSSKRIRCNWQSTLGRTHQNLCKIRQHTSCTWILHSHLYKCYWSSTRLLLPTYRTLQRHQLPWGFFGILLSQWCCRHHNIRKHRFGMVDIPGWLQIKRLAL